MDLEMDVGPCPHIPMEEHIRACVGGSLVGLLLVALLNAPSISEFISSRLTKRKSGNISESSAEASKMTTIRYKLNLIDHLVGGLLVMVMAVTIYTRLSRGVAHWLLQPCHILTAVLIKVTYSSSSEDHLFWVYLYAHWQSYFAFFAGDLSWYTSVVEVYSFWLQHILMTLVPGYYLLVGRFNTKNSSFGFFLTIYTLTVIYHR